MKKLWAVRKDSEAVSPVIATILMVAITVVLAAVLYVMVLGFGADTTQTPTTTLTRGIVTDGVRMTVGTMTADVNWDSINVLLIAGTASATWNNLTNADLTGTGAVIKNFGDENLGTLAVNLVVMDLSGNGKVNAGDYLELTADSFTSGVTYEVRLMYTPTNSPMATQTFTV